MREKFDFYGMLRGYSRKINSPYIMIETLVSMLKRNALFQQNVLPELKQWVENTHEKVFAELTRLSDEQKCIIQGEFPNQRIFLPDFFIEKLENLYFAIEESNGKPFPDDSYFKMGIPAAFIKEISVEVELIEYLSNPQLSLLPIIKLVFPENFGHAFVLSKHMPKRVLEAAMSKLKYIMQLTRTLMFYQQKLMTRFHGQEHRVKRFMENLTVNQSAGVEDLIESNDFTFSSWIFLYPLIKTHVKDTIARDDNISPESIALYQSITLLQSFNNYYKIVSISKRNKALTFTAIDEKMNDPPYMYTFNNLMKLTGPGGVPILQRYTENDLKDWLNQKTISSNKKLPHILKFQAPNVSDFFVRKDKLFMLCSFLLKDLQSKVKLEITNRWTKLMGNYYIERAMENDSDFEALVVKVSKLYAPALMLIMNSVIFDSLQQEIVAEGLDSKKSAGYFSDGKVLPLKDMLELKRSDLLTYCKLSLPFWHSIPFVVALGRVLKHGIKKNAAYYTEVDNRMSAEDLRYLKDSAKKIVSEIVPGNVTLDAYMKSMINRWNQLLNKIAKDKLTQDVDAVIKTYMQYVDKLLTKRILTQSMLDEVAGSIIHSNIILSRISNSNALRVYIKLYIIKTLLA